MEGKQHPDRDAQFRYINAQVTAFHGGSPVISVDAKKKENAGNFQTAAREWRRPAAPASSVHGSLMGLGERMPSGSTT